MTLDSLRRRLNRIERVSGPLPYSEAIRIITRSDDDAARQIADLETAGRLGPHVFLIERRIVEGGSGD